MSEIFNFFRSRRSSEVEMPAKSLPLQLESKSVKSVDLKTSLLAKISIKDHISEFFLKTKDFIQRQKLRNDRNIFIYYFNTDPSKLRIKKNDMRVAVNYCIQRTADASVTEQEKKEIAFFFDKFSGLSKDLFDRTWLGGHVALQRILSPELDELLTEQEKNPPLATATQHQLKVAMAKAHLSIKLGHGMSSAGNGVNGAQIIKDLENNPVGVFKPVPEVKWYQVTEMMKRYFGQARLLNQQDVLGQQFAEVAAHQFDKIMGFKLAPAATMAKIQGKEGAFLAFLQGYQELKACEEKLEARTSYEKDEKKKWQMMCLYNFLAGNMDPHNQNIFMRLNKNNHIEEVRMIDHGNCFIEYNPGAWSSKGNQGQWGTYKISKEAFEPEVIEFIRDNLTEDKLDQFVKQIGKERENFWTIRMDQLQRERLQLIRKQILEGEISTPEQLSQIHTSTDFETKLNMSLSFQAEQTDLGDFAVLDIK